MVSPVLMLSILWLLLYTCFETPLLTDFMVTDELCRCSDPGDQVQVYMLNSSCITSLREFVGHYED